MGKKHKKSAGARSRSSRDSTSQLRSAVEPLLAFASGPLVAEFIAGALGAGAEALTKGKTAKADRAASGNGQRPGTDRQQVVSRQATDMASLVGYAVAVAAGEIAARIVDSYERQMGNGKSVQQTAKAARKAADVAWSAFGTKGGRAAR